MNYEKKLMERVELLAGLRLFHSASLHLMYFGNWADYQPGNAIMIQNNDVVVQLNRDMCKYNCAT